MHKEIPKTLCQRKSHFFLAASIKRRNLINSTLCMPGTKYTSPTINWPITSFLVCSATLSIRRTVVPNVFIIVLFELAFRYGSMLSAWNIRNLILFAFPWVERFWQILIWYVRSRFSILIILNAKELWNEVKSSSIDICWVHNLHSLFYYDSLTFRTIHN